jgi:two-component system response regulator HupR/HoxA
VPGLTPSRRATVLVVDDEVRSLESLRRTLDDDFDVLVAASPEQALDALRAEHVDIVLSDQRMPGTTGVELLRRVRAEWPDVVRLIISGYSDAEDIIGGVNDAGIWQYVLKPWRPDHLLHTLKSAAELASMQREHHRLAVELRQDPAVVRGRVTAERDRERERCSFDRFVRSPGSTLDEVCALAARIAPHELSVLIVGEPGTGKELLARAIHHSSARAERPFVVHDCGGRAEEPEERLEGELAAAFADARGGTLFLDEVGALPPALQARLVRALEDRELRPAGGARPVPVDVRVVSATRRDLEDEVRAGRLRDDLYYRLAGVTLRVPPLRDRPRDVPLLAEALLDRALREEGAPPSPAPSFTGAALACLASHRWPGNVRELDNEVRRMLAVADGPLLGAELVAPSDAAERGEPVAPPPDGDGGTLRDRMERVEGRILAETLTRHRWNKSRAADELGLTRAGLRAKLARHRLEREPR